ncbi:MmcQ/YjbR family DNA-binding protein [Sphingomonas jatrophae]|uniref:Phosphoribosylglycinamide formyltransferase-1/phosphoribosylamine--glycine ligase / phosphoribosylglycinamide formyltransferase / phosphoribosylformylglycinamidine cyclo-ligase n=1 Tax=Sphingomonas jatrophae TaxID=1166337 RepID=A0A1I6L549_9SPHN|nr:phosphoribosylglycinamide formyltransferase-1/phosphoribosylamine--glycine ligase / phosphoribosylglycinamide formyltransferase / phosphoribosylformylglycinamidine cyclo-ligase [Sphingomonas jatrophae]
MSPDPEADLARLREIAMALPEAAEKVSHGAPVFYIDKGKTYAWFSHDHHGNGVTAVIVKVSGLDEHEMLVEREPERFHRPAYFRADQWIAIRVDLPDTDWDYIADRVAMSWELVAPRRLLEAGGR